MLFNSTIFLLVFFPLTVLGFFLFARRGQIMATGWLGFASLVFYGWWDYRYIPLLLSSVIFNYWTSSKIGKSDNNKQRWLILAIAINLGLLGYYKYAGFLVSTTAWLTGWQLDTLHIVLPIGISFFTFTQIAFLVDTYRGKVNERRFVNYFLFVTYFPHLIAGPVLHHKEMMPQFVDKKTYKPRWSNFSIGTSIFFIGLAKKVLIADNLAPYSNNLFDHASTPSFLVAWGGVLAYTFQLYFDFSGYSDMAIGLSRFFGIQLPLNFNSPYKAVNISEFWRRWHMTLSRFLRDYLYIPLGGNRKGKSRRNINLMTTMLLGGLWHGAGWNFVIWGGLHGIYLIIHQAWSSLVSNSAGTHDSALNKFFCTSITFTAVCFAWVFFRAPDLTVSVNIIRGLIGINGTGSLPSAMSALEYYGPEYAIWYHITFAAIIAFLLPNTQEFVARHLAKSVNGMIVEDSSGDPWFRISHPVLPVALGVIAAVSLMNLSRPSDFLYFNF